MQKLINIIKNSLNKLDSRILGHGERVAHLVYTLLKEENKYNNSEVKDATVFALLHDIGALKTDEIDNLITFDSNNTLNHCVYGYLFLKYFSPLKDKSEIILYHHTKYYKLDENLNEYIKDISSLIYLCDRIDVYSLTNKTDIKMFDNDKGNFNDKYYKLFLKLNKDNYLINEIQSDHYKEKINEIDKLFNTNEIKKYLEMLIYAIDFRSYQTVTHSLLVTIIAKDIGRRLGLSNKKINNLYYSALLHDVGKTGTPISILEKEGKLTDKEMSIMRKHVEISKEIIEGNVCPEIMYPAIRHHERSDGSGYPDRLDEHSLTIEDNIIIISDLLGALVMKRSYKEPFSKEKTLGILQDLYDNGKINKDVFNVVLNNYDEIINKANKKIVVQEERFILINEEYQSIKDKMK